MNTNTVVQKANILAEKKLGRKFLLSDPVLVAYGQAWYTCARDPGASEPVLDLVDFFAAPIFWWNTSTNNIFELIAVTGMDSVLTWAITVASNNILSVLAEQGWGINTSRDDSPVTLAANTARQPSVTNDVELSIDFNFTALLSTSSTVVLDTSPDNSTWTTKRTIHLDLGLASNKTLGFTKTIPAGYYYRYVVSGSGTVTVVNHFELTQ